MTEATQDTQEVPPVHIDANMPPLEQAFVLLGGASGVLRALRLEGIYLKTPWSVNKWRRAGRLPRTEYTGETRYAEALERAVRKAGGSVTAVQILESGRMRGFDPP